MRILFVNDGVNDAGGVQSYIDAVMRGLRAKGHELYFLSYEAGECLNGGDDELPHFSVKGDGLDKALSKIKALNPDVCFSHNMHSLEVERELLNLLPVVKLMHGYFGTCIGGQKTNFFPPMQPCGQRFGASCLAQYLPRRCGQLSLEKMLEQYRWARAQNRLFDDYAAVVVASQHMKQEYVTNGINQEKIHVNPLFPVQLQQSRARSNGHKHEPRVLFMGRMTRLKGGDILVRAVAEASKRLGRSIHLVMAGDGPQRAAWEKLCVRLGIEHHFTGWVSDAGERARLLEEATLLAVPSIWPEPFGLVGLEAAWAGVPAVAFDVGGIREWLSDGVNGLLVRAEPPNKIDLARALVDALSEPERLCEMGRAARERAAELSLERHLVELEKILASACALRTAAGN